jgi:HEPN domain-containing protein
MNRSELQQLADLRIREAKVLLDNNCYQGAYYLAGYAIECAFKACIAKETKEYDFPDKKVANKSYTHDLSELLRLARLDDKMDDAKKLNKVVETYWALVVTWNEDARYETARSKKEAEDLYEAVNDPSVGILSWLKNWW